MDEYLEFFTLPTFHTLIDHSIASPLLSMMKHRKQARAKFLKKFVRNFAHSAYVSCDILYSEFPMMFPHNYGHTGSVIFFAVLGHEKEVYV